MATQTDTTRLETTDRETGSSRSTRRLRKSGKVPGILYGLDREPVSFAVDARELRHALAGQGAVLELAIAGSTEPAVVKAAQVHPVRGEITHIDLLRVDLNKVIQAIVPIELEGAEDGPGVKEGGVLEHVTREVNIEALPGDIPETIHFDVSGLQINDTVTLDALTAPQGVTFPDEGLEEIVLVTVTPPRLEQELDEIESETEVVGESKPDADAASDDDSDES